MTAAGITDEVLTTGLTRCVLDRLAFAIKPCAMVTDRPGRRTWRKIFLEKWWQRRRTHIVLFVWAAIYLPGLGSLEIKGEEGRRILPAVTMLQTGNYLVPYVGSEPYFRKPPLVNWIAAASFKLTGFRTEWTARLPSALAILAVALAFVTRGRRALGTTGSLLAALTWLGTARTQHGTPRFAAGGVTADHAEADDPGSSRGVAGESRCAAY